MFEFCGIPAYSQEGITALNCYFAFYWVFFLITTLFALLLALTIYLLWKKRKSRYSFFEACGRLLASPVNNSFWQHLTSSVFVNGICFYFLILASIFSIPILRLTDFMEIIIETDNDFAIYVVNITATFSRILYLFIIFLAMEVISLRSYYIKKNELNLVSSAVDVSERKTYARFVFKKVLIICSILFTVEFMSATICLHDTQDSNKLENILRFLYSLLVLFMGIPRLRVLNYERIMMEQSKYLSRTIHRQSLMKKHLDEVFITSGNASIFVQQLIENSRSECPECGEQDKICSHSVNALLESHILILRTKFMENQEIANANLAAMLPTNARSTVGILKAILLVIIIDFTVTSISFGSKVFFTKSASEFSLIGSVAQFGFRILRNIGIPILILVVLDVKKAFGVFHSVLESSEQEETKPEIGMTIQL